MANLKNRLKEYPEFFLDMRLDCGIRFNWSALDISKVYRAEFWNGNELLHKIPLVDTDTYSPVPHCIIPWHVKAFENDIEIYSEVFTLKDKTVFIKMDSHALGDVLSWMGQVINFKKESGCKKLFIKFNDWGGRVEMLDKERYKADGIFFIERNIECTYYVALTLHFTEAEPHSDSKWHKNKWHELALGQVASDILGITYIETRPYMSIEYKEVTDNIKSIVIGPEATGPGMKHWQRDGGWQHLIDWHNDNGYTVFYSGIKSHRKHGYKNVITLPRDLKSTALAMNNCEYFIGLSSGLSWLAWSLDVTVIMISGMSLEFQEFDDKCVRIINKNVCHGCWHTPGVGTVDGILDKCPEHKGTPRQWECTTSITPEHVIERILSR